ncbi:orotidine-5'-phosphate decarboxylase [Corynebacterium yudongzhengii]|uniref:Orotidine 5'-phosphate decarboxylase n=1 Tax=Corynebacterium yudongzhengii TaxID=2080740 RepID=A0A2U1T7N5_9CORY|nr:orotidine-5'-phosphate decarboxylase [Corynebacterium yudongzhengii]AWB81833.1 orotidine-5'-phosphate decarboxylase [Corynebacterium yudongzhengii]PWC02009.1 orotidine-5'-phosphate decarboxylase [Corynebacterium yudongzhengii]
MPAPGFGARLRAAGARHGRLCVGIDPHAQLLEQWGLSDDIDGLRAFTDACVEAFASEVALIKPQVAFYERFGAAGFQVLEEALAELRSRDTLVVADAKRGDIGSTMAGYAEAWLGERSPLRADAVTVSPYLGIGALNPVFELAHKRGAGVFVLAATSNPEAPAVQRADTGGGVTLAQSVVDHCAAFNRGGKPGDVGVVVGATVDDPPALDELNGPVLMPGVGAQGAGSEDVARIAAGVTDLAFPNVSRSVLKAGPKVGALRAAARAQAEDFPGNFPGGSVHA